MRGTRFFYAGSPHAIVALTPTSKGLEVSISWPCDDELSGAFCVMSLGEFRELLDDAEAVIAATEQAQSSGQYDLFADQGGTNR